MLERDWHSLSHSVCNAFVIVSSSEPNAPFLCESQVIAYMFLMLFVAKLWSFFLYIVILHYI